MGWCERKLFIDQCELKIEFDLSTSDAIELEKAAFQSILASIYRLAHGYAFFNTSPWSREWNYDDERRWIFNQIRDLRGFLETIGMGTDDLDSMISAKLRLPDGQFRDEYFIISSELDLPITPVASESERPLNQSCYWGIEGNGQPLTSLKQATAFMWDTEEPFDSNPAVAFGRLLESVAWPVKVLEHGQLVIDGLPPSILLMLNQHIYPWLFSHEEELALIMDEAVIAAFAKFHKHGYMVLKGEAWDKNERHHAFELIWEFVHSGETSQLVRKYRKGWYGNDNRRKVEWGSWNTVNDPQFGYFTLAPQDLSYDSPNHDAIANHRRNESWLSLRERIGWY